jgi:hypothetical protein
MRHALLTRSVFRGRRSLGALVAMLALGGCLLVDYSGLVPRAPDAESDGSTPGDAGAAGDDASDATPNLNCDAQGLVAHWRFDEGSGTEVHDCSPNAIKGVIVGSAFSWTDAGKYGGALVFNGDDTTHIDMGLSDALQITGDISVCAWVKPLVSSAGNARTIATKGGLNGSVTDPFQGWELGIVTSGPGAYSATFAISYKEGSNLSRTSGVVAATGFTHVCGVFEKGVSVQVYVDGQASPPADASAVAAQHNDPVAAVTVGSRYAENFKGRAFVGTIDELYIFNRPLTIRDVAALAQ